eukprot:TRINITY_DN46650_c0_g1_i1.p1 TRINITY_DN46650_c0_g1~~TRINITY_DN46650_c0_g1_i1.p1  ORF type:complete len:665 (-),score=84.55 TRINITY_DN46650_c0_g1_i1:175-2169(-)
MARSAAGDEDLYLEGFQRSVSVFSNVSRLSDPDTLASKELFSRQCTEIDTLANAAVEEYCIGKTLQEAVAECRFCVTIGDPRMDDCPLTAVSDAFVAMTGYRHEELIGRNCRVLNRDCLLHAEDTACLRAACQGGSPFTGVLLNRKKSGELFQNLIDLRGLTVARNPETGEALWFVIGIQADVSHISEDDMPDHHLSQLQHTVRLIRSRIAAQLSTLAVSGSQVAEIHSLRHDLPPKKLRMLTEPTLMDTSDSLGAVHPDFQPGCVSTGGGGLVSWPEGEFDVGLSDDDELDIAETGRQVSVVPWLAESTIGRHLLELRDSELDLLVSSIIGTSTIADAMIAALADCKFCITIGDPRLPDYPLIAVSDQFEAMTGYSRDEILGNNCRFLNRNCKLNPADLEGLRQACSTGAPFTKTLLNRKKNGELFLNLVDIRGLCVAYNTCTRDTLWFLIGIQADVSHMAADEMPEHHQESLHHVAGKIRAALRARMSAIAVQATLAQPSDYRTHQNSNMWCPLREVKWCPGSQLGGATSRQVSFSRSASCSSARTRQESQLCLDEPQSRQPSSPCRQLSLNVNELHGRQHSSQGPEHSSQGRQVSAPVSLLRAVEQFESASSRPQKNALGKETGVDQKLSRNAWASSCMLVCTPAILFSIMLTAVIVRARR